MGGREIFDGFGIFDDPDCSIIVRYKNGPLRFPLRVTDRSASPPAFLHAVCASGLRVLGSAAFITDPAGTRRILLLCREWAERRENARKQEKKNYSATDHLFPPAGATRLHMYSAHPAEQSLTPCEA